MEEIYKIVVVGCGVDVDYFMHDMSLEEVSMCLDGYFERRKEEYEQYKDEWDRTRWICFWQLRTHSSKENLKLTDIFRFPWDMEEKKEVKAISMKERERMEKKAREIEKKMNHGIG